MAARPEELERLINNVVSDSEEMEIESSTTESGMHLREINPVLTRAEENIVELETSACLGAVGGLAAERGECSRYPESRLSKFSQSTASAEAIELAQVAACNARKAGKLCRITMQATLDAITAGKKKVETTLQSVESAGEVEDIDHFCDLATKYGAAIESVSKLAFSVEAGGETADTAAGEAEEAVINLAEIGNEASAAAEEKLTTAYWAANTANAATILAYKMEFAALKSTKRCWKVIDDSENSGSPKTNRRRNLKVHNRAPPRHNRGSKLLLSYEILAFIFGSSMMTSLGFVENGTIIYYLLLSTGLSLLGLFVARLIYSVCCKKDDRIAIGTNETRRVIKRINERLSELRKYFDENNITPDTSEYSSEGE